MARGGYGNRGVPLAERVRAGAAPAVATPAGPAPAPVPAPNRPPCPAKHCWISLPVDDSAPRPGLLLEWRKGEAGRWEGRVVYLAMLRGERWSLVEEWIPAALLTS